MDIANGERQKVKITGRIFEYVWKTQGIEEEKKILSRFSAKRRRKSFRKEKMSKIIERKEGI